MGAIAENDFGIVIDGKFHRIEWMQDLVHSLSQKVIRNIMEKIEEQLEKNPLKSATNTRNYTIQQVAVMTNKSFSTVTRHCRIGLLIGSKVGKSWLITHENYLKYIDNVYDPNQIIRS